MKQKTLYELTLAGAANVGKSTVFNALTGMKQHTGNWSGKTVFTAEGRYRFDNCEYRLTDTPGTYSLYPASPDELAARDRLLFGQHDCVIITADASCLERSLPIALEITELTSKAVLCLNMADEAARSGIVIDAKELSMQLGIPVVLACARSGKGIKDLRQAAAGVASGKIKTRRIGTEYPDEVKRALSELGTVTVQAERCASFRTYRHEKDLRRIGYEKGRTDGHKRALSLLLLNEKVREQLISDGRIVTDEKISAVLNGIAPDLYEKAAGAVRKRCSLICRLCVKKSGGRNAAVQLRLDRLLTSKKTGIPFIILLFGLIFYLTVSGANYPSELLSRLFGYFGGLLRELSESVNAPPFLSGILLDGAWNTLASVVSVMLPPMAIFFPLFALLEDSGILPRIAFDLDRAFFRAGTQGKQALTMMMGFGCNACGVTGCRMIECPRERKIAAVTNNFCPCNGRFPLIIAMITLFLTSAAAPGLRETAAALILTGVLTLCVLISLLSTKLLSVFVFKGKKSSLVLELPPYRRPQIVKTVVRSFIDKTLKVLLRAVIVAVPAGMLIWLLTHIFIGGESIVARCADFLDPFARLMGLDGTILLSFVLGFPANEIVLPIAVMIYQSGGMFSDIGDPSQICSVLVSNGWTVTTAVCTMLFTVMHFPCSTTLITIRKETDSRLCALIAFVLPTVFGIVSCMLVNLISELIV